MTGPEVSAAPPPVPGPRVAPDDAAGITDPGPAAAARGPAGALAAVRVCARPCPTCPWLVANAERYRYDNLPDYAAGTVPGEPDFARPDPGDPHAPLGVLFACHARPDGRLCAGHVAVVGHEHPLVRLGVAMGLLDPGVLTPGDDWPALHPSLPAMLAATGHQPPTTTGEPT